MKKNRVKIILVIIVVILSALALTACGRIDFTYYQNGDGTYSSKVVITLDGDMTGTGLSLKDAMNHLKSGFTAKGYLVSYDDEAMVIIAEKDYLNIDDLRNDVLGNGLSVSDDNVTEENSDAFMYRQDVDGTPKISKTFFASSSLLVKSALIEGGLNMSQADGVLAACANMDTSYTYVTPYKSAVTNADSLTRDADGNYVHYWDLDDGQSVHIQLARVKGAVWYAVAIISAVAVTLIVALYKVLREKITAKPVRTAEEE